MNFAFVHFSTAFSLFLVRINQYSITHISSPYYERPKFTLVRQVRSNFKYRVIEKDGRDLKPMYLNRTCFHRLKPSNKKL